MFTQRLNLAGLEKKKKTAKICSLFGTKKKSITFETDIEFTIPVATQSCGVNMRGYVFWCQTIQKMKGICENFIVFHLKPYYERIRKEEGRVETTIMKTWIKEIP